MSRTVTALYDSRSEAESARQRLSSAVDADSVRILDQQSESSGEHSSGSSGGGWLSKLFMADDDRQSYGEGMRRGGFLLCAQVDSDQDADRIIGILEETSPVDLDERSQSWRNEGWSGATQSSNAFGSSSNDLRGSDTGERIVQEERIPIAEERLNIGKREVERGGARVHSHVRETPVSEQVTLHDEHVDIERRPVDQTLSSADLNRGDVFHDREIEMRATGEEAVIGKEAHVNEELVVRKTASDHTENVQDRVRHTEVDVEGDGSERGAFGFDRDNERSGQSTSATEFQDDNLNRR